MNISQGFSVTFSSSSIAQMRLAQVVKISTALDRVRILKTWNNSEQARSITSTVED